MSEQLTSPEPAQNDKIMAALAHIYALLPLMGVIARFSFGYDLPEI